MRIDALNQVSRAYAANKTKKLYGIDKTSTSDRLEISQIGKEIQTAKAAVNAAPEVREDRIAEIKAAMANGTFGVSDSDLADKMISDYFDI